MNSKFTKRQISYFHFKPKKCSLNRISLKNYYGLKIKFQHTKWGPSRKSGLTPKTTKVRIVHYVVIQSPQ